MNRQDTIIAPATAVGESGVAIVRISGDKSLLFLDSFFVPKRKVDKFTSHFLYYGHLIDKHGELIDEVMAVYMDSKCSYTFESVVEVHCHGSRQVVKKIISLALNHNIRLAAPGEFTYRAFLNGRLDLTQAEAVSRLIHSTSEFSRKTALSQLHGYLSRQIYAYSHRIKDLVVYLEAWIDFPEEDIPQADADHFRQKVSDLVDEMQQLADTFKVGQVVHDGATVVLVGQPNVGKSSLLNALLQQDRAIVSSIPGTTRDFIEENLNIDGVTLRLVDTAGLRISSDDIEKEGIRRTQEKLKQSDLVLFLHDSTTQFDEQTLNMIDSVDRNLLVLVLTKIDLAGDLPVTDFHSGTVCCVSSHTGAGIDTLKSTISTLLYKNYHPDTESAYITERRHYEALLLSVQCLNRFLANYEQLTADLVAADLRDALRALGMITGQVTVDSILDGIFSKFCIGK